MVSDINFLLVGNSRLHWAKYSKKQTKFFHTQKEQKIPENIDLDKLIWASVGKLPDFLLKKENEIKTKEIKLSDLPDYFGVDRALACIASLKIIDNPFKKDLLIADFGTILSITKFNSNGSLIGGQLIPGFLTQLKSIEQNTKNLKVPTKYDIPIKDFLINTEEAILKGVINSLTGAINSLFNPSKDILVICGGDSQLLIESLKTQKANIINAPNLVMEGMIIHHLCIKNQFKPRSAII
jgi:type III pantothenate kinase